jgi:glycosyltransferase involved in cell wall biosynthesis
MKIAIVHSYYSDDVPSGENVVVEAQARVLRSAGVEVQVVAARTDDLRDQKGYKFRTALNVATGNGLSPLETLREFSPDLVHVHNLFPNWGKSWLKAWRGPIIATVHNFRPVCAAGTLFRDGATCTLCPTAGSHHAVVHGCYRDSKVASIPLAIQTRKGVPGDALLERADKVILLSERVRAMYSSFGLRDEKTTLIPNFVSANGFNPDETNGNDWVYIGRLSAEKGIMNLLAFWPAHHNLRIYGDGPLREQVLAASGGNITYCGKVDRAEIPNVLSKSKGLIFSSEWFEGAIPLTYVEALAAGRPVVALNGNGASDDILKSGVGYVYERWDQLAATLDEANVSIELTSRKSRIHYDEQFTESVWLSSTIDLYTATISDYGANNE